MFDELRELADTVKVHAPRVVDELQRAVDAIAIGAESVARIADVCNERRASYVVETLVRIADALDKSPAIARDQLTIDEQEVTK